MDSGSRAGPSSKLRRPFGFLLHSSNTGMYVALKFKSTYQQASSALLFEIGSLRSYCRFCHKPTQCTMTTNLSAQYAVDDALASLTTWKASLPFEHVEGFDGAVDLFQYTDSSQHKRMYKHSSEKKPPVVFDTVRYPPTNEGISNLMKDLKRVAANHGSKLGTIHGSGRLNCHRCRMISREKSTWIVPSKVRPRCKNGKQSYRTPSK